MSTTYSGFTGVSVANSASSILFQNVKGIPKFRSFSDEKRNNFNIAPASFKWEIYNEVPYIYPVKFCSKFKNIIGTSKESVLSVGSYSNQPQPAELFLIQSPDQHREDKSLATKYGMKACYLSNTSDVIMGPTSAYTLVFFPSNLSLADYVEHKRKLFFDKVNIFGTTSVVKLSNRVTRHLKYSCEKVPSSSEDPLTLSKNYVYGNKYHDFSVATVMYCGGTEEDMMSYLTGKITSYFKTSDTGIWEFTWHSTVDNVKKHISDKYASAITNLLRIKWSDTNSAISPSTSTTNSTSSTSNSANTESISSNSLVDIVPPSSAHSTSTSTFPKKE